MDDECLATTCRKDMVSIDLWRLVKQKGKKEDGSLRVVAVIGAVIFDKIMTAAHTSVVRNSRHSMGCRLYGRTLTPVHGP